MSHECLCVYCKSEFSSPMEGLDICPACEDEFAVFLEEHDLEVGEFDDVDHPSFNPHALRGTKWEYGPTWTRIDHP